MIELALSTCYGGHAFLIARIGLHALLNQGYIGLNTTASRIFCLNQSVTAELENSGNGMPNQVFCRHVLECRRPRNAVRRSRQTARRPNPLTRRRPGKAVRPPFLLLREGASLRRPRAGTAVPPPLLLKESRPLCLLHNHRRNCCNKACRTQRPSTKSRRFNCPRCSHCGQHISEPEKLRREPSTIA